MTATLEGGEWSAEPHSRSLPPGKTRYPLYRRLDSKVLLSNVLLFSTIQWRNVLIWTYNTLKSDENVEHEVTYRIHPHAKLVRSRLKTYLLLRNILS